MSPTYVVSRAGAVQVWDVLDIEAFVRSCIPKTKLKLAEREEREELVSEGIAIALDLAGKFKPRMEGHDKDGSYAGYLAMFLPKKMFSAWHRWHPEHLQEMQEQPDGTMKKRYVYAESPASLDEYVERRGDDSNGMRALGNFIRTT